MDMLGTPKSEGDDFTGFDEDEEMEDVEDEVEGEGDGTFGGVENAVFGAPRNAAGGAQVLPNGKKTKGRVKIKMEYIGNKLRRYTTFSKRKTGIMKKAHELSTLTGTQVMLLVASETGHVYAFATHKLKPMIASEPGKRLIQHCLNAADHENCPDIDDTIRTEFTLDPQLQQLPQSHPQAGAMNARKRKLIADTELLGLPTMVSPGRLPFVSSPHAGPSSESSLTLDESFGVGADDDDDEEQENDGKELAENFSATTKKWRPDIMADKRVKTTPRRMKWTTQTLSPPPQPDSGLASTSAPPSSANSNKQAQLHRTLKEVLKYAADQRQRQKQQSSAQQNANGMCRQDVLARNGNNNKSSQQQQQFSKNQQAAFQQQLSAMLPFMLQAAAFGNNGVAPLSADAPPLGFTEAAGSPANDDENDAAVGGAEIDVTEVETGSGDASPAPADNPLQHIFGGKFPFGNNAFQQLFANAALSQKISENSRS